MLKIKVKPPTEIRFKPHRNIFMTGTDPVLLLEELAELGDHQIIPQFKDVPFVDELNPEECHIFWDIILTTEVDYNTIKDVFIFVEDDCELSIDIIADELSCECDEDLKRLGEILVERNDLSPDAINEALLEQKKIGEILVDSQNVDKQTLESALAEQKQLKKVKDKRCEDKGGASSLRVASDKLDVLVDLVGELVTVQARLTQLSSTMDHTDLTSISEEVERLTSELRDNTMSIRMMPIGTTFSKFRRLVRDLSAQLGKNIDLITEGAETELDKTVLDRLDDPLVHLIRNSIDHGIESPEDRKDAGKSERGTIKLSAGQKGAYVVITIADDGGGLDIEAIRKKSD